MKLGKDQTLHSQQIESAQINQLSGNCTIHKIFTLAAPIQTYNRQLTQVGVSWEGISPLYVVVKFSIIKVLLLERPHRFVCKVSFRGRTHNIITNLCIVSGCQMMYYSSQNIILDAVVMFQKVTNPCVDTQFTGARIINIFRILSGVQLYKLVQFTAFHIESTAFPYFYQHCQPEMYLLSAFSMLGSLPVRPRHLVSLHCAPLLRLPHRRGRGAAAYFPTSCKQEHDWVSPWKICRQ